MRGDTSLQRRLSRQPNKFVGESYPQEDGFVEIISHEPPGMTAGIVPRNGPIGIVGLKAGPALVTGNCFISEPESMTSRTSTRSFLTTSSPLLRRNSMACEKTTSRRRSKVPPPSLARARAGEMNSLPTALQAEQSSTSVYQRLCGQWAYETQICLLL